MYRFVGRMNHQEQYPRPTLAKDMAGILDKYVRFNQIELLNKVVKIHELSNNIVLVTLTVGGLRTTISIEMEAQFGSIRPYDATQSIYRYLVDKGAIVEHYKYRPVRHK